jgi:hypothetical protein
MEKPWIRDPGWRNLGSGIRDKHPGSATLVDMIYHTATILSGAERETAQEAECTWHKRGNTALDQ